jgi:hypothetical protein
MRRQARRQPRGFVLLVVLALLVLLTIVASLTFLRASDAVVGTVAVRRQMIAQDRAMAGMQEAIAIINDPATGTLSALQVSPPCTNADPDVCVPFMDGGIKDNGTGFPLDPQPGQKPGGLQYVQEYYAWQPSGGGGDAGTSMTIVARITGFHGYSGSTVLTSVVVVELGYTAGAGFGTGGYVGGGL